MQYILTEEEYNNLVPKKIYNNKYCDDCPINSTGTCNKRKNFSQ